MVMDAIYSHIRFDELLQDFLSIFYMAIIGANYEFLDSPYGLGLIYVFPFIFVIIVSIVVLIFVNYTFVYRKFGIPNNKKWELSFFTALANAPYELLIPYGQIASMIIDRMMF